MSGTEWFCGVQLGGVKLPAEFPAARNSKSMVHAGTGRWRQKNGRPMLIVGSRLAVYRMAVFIAYKKSVGYFETVSVIFLLPVLDWLIDWLGLDLICWAYKSAPGLGQNVRL